MSSINRSKSVSSQLKLLPQQDLWKSLFSCFSFSFALLYTYFMYKRGARKKMRKQGYVSVRSFQGRLPGQLCWVFSSKQHRHVLLRHPPEIIMLFRCGLSFLSLVIILSLSDVCSGLSHTPLPPVASLFLPSSPFLSMLLFYISIL